MELLQHSQALDDDLHGHPRSRHVVAFEKEAGRAKDDVVAPAHDVFAAVVVGAVAVEEGARRRLDGLEGYVQVLWDRVPPHVLVGALAGAVTVYARIVVVVLEQRGSSGKMEDGE